MLLSFTLGSNAYSAPMCSNIFGSSNFNLKEKLAERVIKSLSFKKPLSEVQLNEKMASYYFYKKGDILNFSDFKVDQLTRQQRVFARLLERQVMTDGVKFLFQKEWQNVTPSGYRRFMIKWGEFQQSSAWQVLSKVPLQLPKMKTEMQSQEILQDLVLNGERSVYWAEGQKIYNRTARAEFYRKLNRVYMVVAYSFMIYSLEETVTDAMDKMQEEENENAKQDFMAALAQLETQVKTLESQSSQN